MKWMKTTEWTNLKTKWVFSIIASMLFCATATYAATIPPERMTYQGFLINDSGIALATNQPANYILTFRIYKEQNAAYADALWEEEQTVTVDKGYFSVLLGESGSASTNLYSVFNSPNADSRYIGITVAANGNDIATDLDIKPRLRLVSSPYAFLAHTAARVLDSSISSSSIATDSLTAANLAVNAVGASEIATDAVGADEIITNAVGAAEIATDAVGMDEIARDAVGADEIAQGAVGADEIAAGAVGSSELAANITISSSITAGDPSGLNTILNVNQLRAENNATPSTLYFNHAGGDVQVGGQTGVKSQLKVNQKSVPVGEENLRIIRGEIDGTTTPAAGTGFTVTYQEVTDMCTITYSEAFSAVPTVIISVHSTGYEYVIWGHNAASADVTLYNSAGTPVKGAFSFIAIGPR